jgi:type IV secretory pathway VirJ component
MKRLVATVAILAACSAANAAHAPRPARAVARQQKPAVVANSLADLPLIEVPTAVASDTFAVMISGDGGWAAIDKAISRSFADAGIPVVGLNALEYLWKKKTPDLAARDLERIIGHYGSVWKRERVVLAGYSRGADVLAVVTNRLSPAVQQKIRLLALLGPSRSVEFEFHVSDWFSDPSRGLPTLPEIRKLKGKPTVCIYGASETDSLCRDLGAGAAVLKPLKGAHHFDGNYEALARLILEELK